MRTIVVVTGGMDPIHSGHISYLKHAKKLGDKLIVGVNSDEWLTRKKGQPFMSWFERSTIIENLNPVDEVIAFDDSDNTAIDAIRKVKERYPNDHIVFANGGDRTHDNIPEMVFDDVDFRFSVGGDDKKNSSSWILKEWSQPTVQRKWGTYKVLDKNGSWTVKELSFDPVKALSDQRHTHRDEHWHIVKGTIRMELEFANGDRIEKIYSAGESIDIMKGTWHKATNIGDEAAKVIEVWVGENLSEGDIERRD